VTLTLFATSRVVEAQATGDTRFITAADAIKQMSPSWRDAASTARIVSHPLWRREW